MTSLALGMAELDNIWFEILMLGIVGMVMGIVRNHLLIEILHELRKLKESDRREERGK